MNENFWDSLPVKIQHQLVEAMKETTDWQFEQAARMNEQDMLKLKQQDDFDVSTMSLKERQRFKEQLAPVYDFYRAQLQNDSILTEIEKNCCTLILLFINDRSLLFVGIFSFVL
ncbi:hypothetical protein OL548_27525 [Lysinibacillus sp. MHQ-1]|nr:hypothetical protein OL548_27525 [Lysinibacillus sp. MHQ-1]